MGMVWVVGIVGVVGVLVEFKSAGKSDLDQVNMICCSKWEVSQLGLGMAWVVGVVTVMVGFKSDGRNNP